MESRLGLSLQKFYCHHHGSDGDLGCRLLRHENRHFCNHNLPNERLAGCFIKSVNDYPTVAFSQISSDGSLIHVFLLIMCNLLLMVSLFCWMVTSFSLFDLLLSTPGRLLYLSSFSLNKFAMTLQDWNAIHKSIELLSFYYVIRDNARKLDINVYFINVSNMSVEGITVRHPLR